MTRGIRNNNPGNIENNPRNPWQGFTGDDGRYAIFDEAQNGIRALVKVLRSYKRQGIDTVAEIITRWAPPSENDTATYIRTVAGRIGVAQNERIDIENFDTVVIHTYHIGIFA